MFVRQGILPNTRRAQKLVRRGVERTIQVTAAQAAAGQVLVHGTAATQAPLQDPITSEPVLGYRVLVECRRPLGETESVGRQIEFDGTAMADFEVVDSTGRLPVRLPRCQLLTNFEQYRDHHAMDLLTPALTAMLEPFGMVNSMISAHQLWVTVGRIPVGVRVYALGQVEQSEALIDGSGTYRQPPARGRRLGVDADSKLEALVTDMAKSPLLRFLDTVAARVLYSRLSLAQRAMQMDQWG